MSKVDNLHRRVQHKLRARTVTNPPPSVELDGQETYCLALIAQNPNKRNRDVQRIIAELEGDAKLVGRCLAGYCWTIRRTHQECGYWIQRLGGCIMTKHTSLGIFFSVMFFVWCFLVAALCLYTGWMFLLPLMLISWFFVFAAVVCFDVD